MYNGTGGCKIWAHNLMEQGADWNADPVCPTDWFLFKRTTEWFPGKRHTEELCKEPVCTLGWRQLAGLTEEACNQTSECTQFCSYCQNDLNDQTAVGSICLGNSTSSSDCSTEGGRWVIETSRCVMVNIEGSQCKAEGYTPLRCRDLVGSTMEWYDHDKCWNNPYASHNLKCQVRHEPCSKKDCDKQGMCDTMAPYDHSCEESGTCGICYVPPKLDLMSPGNSFNGPCPCQDNSTGLYFHMVPYGCVASRWGWCPDANDKGGKSECMDGMPNPYPGDGGYHGGDGGNYEDDSHDEEPCMDFDFVFPLFNFTGTCVNATMMARDIGGDCSTTFQEIGVNITKSEVERLEAAGEFERLYMETFGQPGMAEDGGTLSSNGGLDGMESQHADAVTARRRIRRLQELSEGTEMISVPISEACPRACETCRPGGEEYKSEQEPCKDFDFFFPAFNYTGTCAEALQAAMDIGGGCNSTFVDIGVAVTVGEYQRLNSSGELHPYFAAHHGVEMSASSTSESLRIPHMDGDLDRAIAIREGCRVTCGACDHHHDQGDDGPDECMDYDMIFPLFNYDGSCANLITEFSVSGGNCSSPLISLGVNATRADADRLEAAGEFDRVFTEWREAQTSTNATQSSSSTSSGMRRRLQETMEDQPELAVAEVCPMSCGKCTVPGSSASSARRLTWATSRSLFSSVEKKLNKVKEHHKNTLSSLEKYHETVYQKNLGSQLALHRRLKSLRIAFEQDQELFENKARRLQYSEAGGDNFNMTEACMSLNSTYAAEWIPMPKDKLSCIEKKKCCSNFGIDRCHRFTDNSLETCSSSCGGKIMPIFHWTSWGSWVQGKMETYKWLQREMNPVNTYATTLKFDRVFDTIQAAVQRAALGPRIAFLECRSGPTINIVRKAAMCTGADVSPGDEAAAKCIEGSVIPLGEATVLPGSASQESFGKNKIVFGEGSTTDAVQVVALTDAASNCQGQCANTAVCEALAKATVATNSTESTGGTNSTATIGGNETDASIGRRLLAGKRQGVLKVPPPPEALLGKRRLETATASTSTEDEPGKTGK
eukprot:GHVT01002520.1.p1 GENE.GHVT01002520.1~~GHVT01002520.1.p1  ORF type:complete len:1200 (+),score=116.56 GHVT01002520.1:437-3601(+)